jgi:hypothetical protein
VAKGDLMVSNGDGTARAEADPRAGAIIGKALEDSEDVQNVYSNFDVSDDVLAELEQD